MEGPKTLVPYLSDRFTFHGRKLAAEPRNAGESILRKPYHFSKGVRRTGHRTRHSVEVYHLPAGMSQGEKPDPLISRTQNDLDCSFAFRQDRLIDFFAVGNREIRLKDPILFYAAISVRERHPFECCLPKPRGSAFDLQGSSPPARWSLWRAIPWVGAPACKFERVVFYCEHLEAAEVIVRDLRVFPDGGLHRTCAFAFQTVSRSPKDSST